MSDYYGSHTANVNAVSHALLATALVNGYLSAASAGSEERDLKMLAISHVAMIEALVEEKEQESQQDGAYNFLVRLQQEWLYAIDLKELDFPQYGPYGESIVNLKGRLLDTYSHDELFRGGAREWGKVTGASHDA